MSNEAQEHRFEAVPLVVVQENFVAWDVLSQLQRVMDNPRLLLAANAALRAGDQPASARGDGPYLCISPDDPSPCKWRIEKALSK